MSTLVLVLAAPWAAAAFFILVYGAGGPNCTDPSSRNCGDSGTASYAWFQAGVMVTSIVCAVAARRARDPVAAGLLSRWSGGLLLGWVVLVALRTLTAGQWY